MKEICTIDGKNWCLRELPYVPEHQYFSWAFYDRKTGEVWGRRAIVGALHNAWLFEDRERSSMDLTFWQERGQGIVPPGLLCALVVGQANELLQPTIPG